MELMQELTNAMLRGALEWMLAAGIVLLVAVAAVGLINALWERI